MGYFDPRKLSQYKYKSIGWTIQCQNCGRHNTMATMDGWCCNHCDWVEPYEEYYARRAQTPVTIAQPKVTPAAKRYVRPEGGPQTTSARIRELAAQGKSVSVISSALGIRYQHAYQVVRKMKGG